MTLAKRLIPTSWHYTLSNIKRKIFGYAQFGEDNGIDLLTIDAEGMDMEVLQSYDWKHNPKAIVIEEEESKQFLAKKGNALHAECGASRIYTYGN